MHVDFVTLTAAGGFGAFVSGLLLVVAGLRYARSRAAFQLGASHLFAAIAIMLLAFDRAFPSLSLLAQPVFVLAAILAFCAALSFEKSGTLSQQRIGLVLGLAVFSGLIVVGLDAGLVRIVQLAITSPLFLLAAWVLWSGRSENLRARQPLAAIFLIHGFTNSIGFAEAVLRQALPSGVPSFSDWYGLIHIESVIYFTGTALFMVALIKERSEARHRTASLTDPLTGLPNRRAFLRSCNRLLARGRSHGPYTVLAVDLDRFKSVNDIFGHATGDRVLQIFADVAREHLRPLDQVGRLGGEEFAILLPRTHTREGVAIADRLRAGFAERASIIGEQEVGATMSVGVATLFGHEATIGEVLERADDALYRAKLNGRDRVEVDAEGKSLRLLRASGQ